ncbi:MAG: hypothetical protein LBU67_05765 [Oscillospiraceae bacterium]|jgi:hypothetical protein|nr:hypothetical protein [Oscillospiraceae bacterium]
MLESRQCRIEQAIARTNAKLLILASLQAYSGVDVDMRRANEMRSIFKALASVAMFHSVCG